MAGKGNPEWKKGKSGNPSGRPKGAKNKLTVEVIPKIMEVWNELEATRGLKGVGKDNKPRDRSLFATAYADPAWFYQQFIKRLIPTNIDLGVFLPQLEKAENLPDSILLGILKDRPIKIESKKKKASE